MAELVVAAAPGKTPGVGFGVQYYPLCPERPPAEDRRRLPRRPAVPPRRPSAAIRAGSADRGISHCPGYSPRAAPTTSTTGPSSFPLPEQPDLGRQRVRPSAVGVLDLERDRQRTRLAQKES